MQGWEKAKKAIDARMQELATQYGTKCVDGAFNWLKQVGDVHVGATFIFRYNSNNKKVWAVQSIDKFLDGDYKSHNEYLDHRENTASEQEVMEMFEEWVSAISDTVNEYKSQVDYYQHLLDK